MKVKATKQMAAEIQRMLDEQALDHRITNDVSYFVEENTVVIDDGSRTAKMESDADCIDYAFNVVAKGNNVYTEEAQQALITPYVRKAGRVFKEGAPRDNPYLNTVRPQDERVGKFKLGWAYYQPYQLFSYMTASWIDGHYLTAPALGYFEDNFVFPYFIEDGKTGWMSITPNEIFTMERPVKEAHGKVLTLGCGMGYYAYMAALKDDVESVTIVELEPDVIELFKTAILPFFEHPEKINIVCEDAYVFMKDLVDGDYDYCFADTWIGGNDVSDYLLMRDACSHLKKTQVSYWIEDSFLKTLIKLASYEVLDAWDIANGKSVGRRNLHPDLIAASLYLHEVLKDTVVPTPASLQRLLSKKGILAALEKATVPFVSVVQ